MSTDGDIKFLLTPCESYLLEKNNLLPGDLYYKKRSGKTIKIVTVGELYSPALKEKYIKTSEQFLCHEIVKPILTQKFREVIFKFESAMSEVERLEKRASFLRVIEDAKNHRLYDVVYSLAHIFNWGESRIERELSEASVTQHKRALIVGTFNVILAIGYGILDFSILKDLFSVGAIYDRKQVIPTSIYGFESVMETARGSPDSINGWGELIKKEYLEHTSCDLELMKELQYQELIDLVRYHHEGETGFPLNLSNRELTPLQNIVIGVNEFTPYSDVDFKTEIWGKWFDQMKLAIHSRDYLQRLWSVWPASSQAKERAA